MAMTQLSATAVKRCISAGLLSIRSQVDDRRMEVVKLQAELDRGLRWAGRKTPAPDTQLYGIQFRIAHLSQVISQLEALELELELANKSPELVNEFWREWEARNCNHAS